MPDLFQSFHSSDIGLLRIVAGLWDLDLSSPETEAARKELAEALLEPERVVEILDLLSAESFTALDVLVSAGGKFAWAAFVRQFGEIRDAGPGRRDREQVYLHPISAAETLYYRALMSRAFFDTPNGPQEFAYIPDDLLQVLTPVLKSARQVELTRPILDSQSEPLGRPALPKEREHPVPVFDCLLDDATTLLAALRMAITIPDTSVPGEVLRSFLQVAGILAGDEPLAEEVRSFFEAPRTQALSRLRKAWKVSESFNELHLVPGLECEGEWSNQPKVTRNFLLDLLRSIPVEKWWSLPAFIRAVKDKFPDFQRPSGDYDFVVHQANDRQRFLARLRLLGRSGRGAHPLLGHRSMLLAGHGGACHGGRGRSHYCIPIVNNRRASRLHRERKTPCFLPGQGDCPKTCTTRRQVPDRPFLHLGGRAKIPCRIQKIPPEIIRSPAEAPDSQG